MANHHLTIVASGLDHASQDYADRFYEAGCDDATLSVQKGLFVLEFDRSADSFENALDSAITDVRKAGAKVERVEPDYLVSASEIAARCGQTRQAISLYASGQRGKGFPSPVARITTESPLWDWAEVSSWMSEHRILSKEIAEEARIIRRVNHDL